MADFLSSADDKQQRINFFAGVEALRKEALLSIGDMVVLLNTSRTNYAKWRAGTKPRPEAAQIIDKRVKLLLDLYDGNANHPDPWPTENARSASAKQRSELFLAHLNANDDFANT